MMRLRWSLAIFTGLLLVPGFALSQAALRPGVEVRPVSSGGMRLGSLRPRPSTSLPETAQRRLKTHRSVEGGFVFTPSLQTQHDLA
jgi:hypothetical protein